MTFLEKLDIQMKGQGLNKSKLSQISGVPYTTIDGFYKKGYGNAKISTIRKIAQALGCSLDYLMEDDSPQRKNYTDQDNESELSGTEREHIKKYRSLDDHGKEAVDAILDIEHRRCEVPPQEAQQEAVYYICPGFLSPMSAGTGQLAGEDYPENYRLIKEPPRGTSFIARVSGDSMEPTYHDGNLVFVHSAEEIPVGKIGAFFMDGQQWIKERGEGVLISHNPAYGPRPMTADVQCQGLVLGVCDSSYFE